MTTKTRRVAVRIINQLDWATSPEQCTWGSNHPAAHREIFSTYQEDLIRTVAQVLNDCEWEAKQKKKQLSLKLGKKR